MAASSILTAGGVALFFLSAIGHSQLTTAPTDNADARAHCMFVPQRMDDFAWENDRVAFRAYGPALQKQDGPQSGIDIWVKRVPRLVQADWYKTGDYHHDNGEGLDGYKVGASRGCGGTAIVHDGKLVPSGNYTAHRIIENGPDRVVFELDYGPWDVAGTSVKETKRITLTAGSDFNEIVSTFTFDGPPLMVGIGLKVHPMAKTWLPKPGEPAFLSTWEPLDGENNGNLGCAVVLPDAGDFKLLEQEGDVLLLVTATSGKPITYYSGGGWSKAGFADERAWKVQVAKFAGSVSGDGISRRRE